MRYAIVFHPEVLRDATALALTLMAALSSAEAAAPCLAPGVPIQWRADYCMLLMETDDEIAVSACIEQEGRRRFPGSCASNTHFKKRMCEAMIKRGTRQAALGHCARDPAFMGRTVERGGAGGTAKP